MDTDTAAHLLTLARLTHEHAQTALTTAGTARARAITRGAVSAGELAGMARVLGVRIGQYAIGASLAFVEASETRTLIDGDHWLRNAADYAQHAVDYLELVAA